MGNCCCGPLEHESCGWPTGTIRAVIALVTILCSFGAAIAVMIMLIVKDQYAIAVGINSSIWGIVGGIIGYYFGTKATSSANNSVVDAKNETISMLCSQVAAPVVGDPEIAANRIRRQIRRNPASRNVPLESIVVDV